MSEISKTQTVRLIDVFVIGPVMIYAALGKRPPKIVQTGLLLFGIATILYNARNYLLNRYVE